MVVVHASTPYVLTLQAVSQQQAPSFVPAYDADLDECTASLKFNVPDTACTTMHYNADLVDTA